jgi:hypothetical protein
MPIRKGGNAMAETGVKPRDANEAFSRWKHFARMAVGAKYEATLEANVALAIQGGAAQTDWQAYTSKMLKRGTDDLNRLLNTYQTSLLVNLEQNGMEAAMAEVEALLDRWRLRAEEDAREELQRIVGK